MTPTELITYIRQRHNAVGDNFYSDSEILAYVYDACLQMGREFVIERTYTTTTVAGTREYSYPTNTIAIKRVTYDGAKLKPFNFREDDLITGLYETTASQGTPQFYAVWNETLYLRPIPDAARTLKIYSFNEPQVITTTSTLEIPTQFHVDTADYVIAMLQAKEQNYEGSRYWMQNWEKRLLKIRQWSMKRLRRDANAHVINVEATPETYLGTV